MRPIWLVAVFALFLTGCITVKAPPPTIITQTTTVSVTTTVTSSFTRTETVYVGNSGSASPNISFNQDNSAHRLTIVAADSDADWQAIQLGFGGSHCRAGLNGGYPIESGSPVYGSQSIYAGDTLSITNTQAGNCNLTLRYNGQLLGAWTFTFSQPTSAPNITFNQDNAGHTLTIVSADAAANWQNVKGSISGGSSCTYTLRSGATTSAATVMTTGSAAVAAGDTITVSGSSGSSCVLSLTYTTVNQLLGSWTFTF